MLIPWSASILNFASQLSLIAQASPSPNPTASPRSAEVAAIEFLKAQFQSLTTTFNIYVSLISAVSVIFVGFAAWFFKRTLSEAKQEVDQLVKAEVKRQIAATVSERVNYLEQILQREEVPSLVSVDYVLQNASIPPKEYRLLNARFSKLKIRRLDSRKFNGDVVVLDLVNYQPKISALPKPKNEDELTRILDEVIDKISPDAVLAIYIEGQYDAIKNLGQKLKYYTSTNLPPQLLGNVVNAAYVAHALRDADD
jgi:hypothetical protein